MSARLFSIPDNLLHIHGYHPERKYLEERLAKANVASLGKTEGVKGKLLVKQKGLCDLCGKSLFLTSENTVLETGFLDVDHLTPISKGGSKTDLKNLRLIHRWCHVERHKDPNQIDYRHGIP